MSNPIILARIKYLYDSGQIDAAALASFVDKGFITQSEASAIAAPTA